MAKRTRIVAPLLGLIVGLVLVVGVLASRSQEDRVASGDGGRPAQDRQDREARDIDVRLTEQGLQPRSATVRKGDIVQWRNETPGAVRFLPAKRGDIRTQGLSSSPVGPGRTWAFRPVESGRLAYRAEPVSAVSDRQTRGVLEVR